MAKEIQTWEIIDNQLTQIDTTLAENGRKEKDDLEVWLKTKPEIIGNDILIIGEQVYTKSGPLDFLGIDNNGNIVIIELKRDRLSRDVLAQAVDYASDVSNWDVEKLNEICLEYSKKSLEDYLSEKFDDIDTDNLIINQSQRLILVGFAIDESLNRMIEWLSGSFDIAINAVILNYIKTSKGNEVLSRTVIIPEEVTKEKSNKRKFKIEMSDEAGKHDSKKLKSLLKAYFLKDNWSAMRIRTVLFPSLLEKEAITREQFKKEFVKKGKADDEKQAGYFIALISTQLGQAKRDYLRQIISYEYPDNNWTKNNFRIREDYRELVTELLVELDANTTLANGKAKQ